MRARGIGSVLASEKIILPLTVVYFLTVLPLAPDILRQRNLLDIAANVMPLLIVAVGQTCVLISGGIDLSVTSIISVASITGAAVMSGDGGLLAGSPLAAPGAFVAMVGVGAVIGAANGVAVALLGMPAFMVTLATMIFAGGLAVWATGAETIGDLPNAFVFLGFGDVLGVPAGAFVALTGSLLVWLLLERTIAGRWLRAVGHSQRAARASGVPVRRVLVLAYITSGACAGLAAILYTARLETGSPVLGERLLLDIIGAVVIGGTSLFGGTGRVSWTLWGVLFMTVMSNSLEMLELTFAQITIAKGTLILLAALLDAWRQRVRKARPATGATA